MLLYHFGSKDGLLQAILRAARTRERWRAFQASDVAEGSERPVDVLRRTWTHLSAPREHAFWRFYYEIHGLALQNPQRYPDVLHQGVHDWLETARVSLTREGIPEEQANAIATLIVGAFRGLMLDLLQTGERERVDAGFEALANITEVATTRAISDRKPTRGRA